MPRNGNGKSGGNGGQDPVPRWVRTLFDQHEARMAAHEAQMAAHEERMDAYEHSLAEMKAEHKERMDELERFVKTVQREEIETRRQTREVVLVIGRLDATLLDIRDSLKGFHGRVSRLERK